jgi:beta-lactam-binding protein with PASTA domain
VRRPRPVTALAPLALVLLCSACSAAKTSAHETVRVPDVVGRPWEEAVSAIGRAGLCIGAIAWGDGSIGAEPDRVLAQNPRPGAMAAPHQRVGITVSPSGPSASIVTYSLAGCAPTNGDYFLRPSG